MSVSLLKPSAFSDKANLKKLSLLTAIRSDEGKVMCHIDKIEDIDIKHYFEELMRIFGAAFGLERAHMGLFIQLSVIYAKHNPSKLTKHMKVFWLRINILKVIRTASEHAHLWPELVFFYVHYDEFDNAVLAMMEQSAYAWDHSQCKDVTVKDFDAAHATECLPEKVLPRGQLHRTSRVRQDILAGLTSLLLDLGLVRAVPLSVRAVCNVVRAVCKLVRVVCLGHNGFYNTLFLSKNSDAHVLPYIRIVETIKMIAGQAAEHTQQNYGTTKKTNLYVGAHSLGAGIAQLLYARFLESPEDLRDQVTLRDTYVFGTPRACDFKLASRVNYNMNRPINQVSPGFADKRETRCGLQGGSYYAYAAIGTLVDLTPNALGPPFYDIEEAPVGHSVEVYKKADEAENEFARSRESAFIMPRDIVQLSMQAVTYLVPVLHNHFPASYMDSLYKVQAKTAYGKIKGNKIKSKQEQHQQSRHNKDNPNQNAAAPTSTTPRRHK
ncbi:hypothetical protein PSTG_03759 [Puccinia striiformis f. sp. tritici PST-78]|uniref:Fungal lipase-type domain-containing protein n=1 Tax=Puccinia striiformis f. sp. tritici PST-78 TaxID=1165861 RepID=A0A0L0VVE6_9BASI|nr:hypothetical protein PSTG_03759 [Puccinia striiformis f. sp. tritici PST-78]